MAEVLKEWRGQVVDGKFPLVQYLCGSDQSAVFSTGIGERASQKAALKLIPDPSGMGSERLQRWQEAAKLSHANLLKIFSAGRWKKDDRAFLYVVMELADEDLSQILPQRRLSPNEVRAMLEPLLRALSYLHQRNLVHGHLKPSNIQAIGDHLKISSDGLQALGDLLHTGSTPSIYLAPEVDNQGLSPASDIWSLGVILVEVLTQRPPAWEDKQLRPSVPGNLPSPFREIAENCLQPDPARRWTPPQILASLSAGSSTVPVQAPAPARPSAPSNRPPVVVAARPSSRNRFAVPAAVIAVLVLGVLLAMKFAGHSAAKDSTTPTTQSEPAQPTQTTAVPSTTESVQPAVTPSPTEKVSDSNSTRGEVVKQIVPDVPRSARSTIHGTVRVSVLAAVDPSGNVSGTRFERRGPSAYFANLAMKAARDWKFKSPQVDGREVASDWTLNFDFKRSGTEVHSVQRSR